MNEETSNNDQQAEEISTAGSESGGYPSLTATYSPEDNKLRLTSLYRLPKELYTRVRAAGFIWAPKQEIFVAPMWTPSREDLLIELCGEIGDEDTSLVDRAEQRAERFEDYSDKRKQDAVRAKAGVDRIADGIPFGQPILVGHHSERHARKDAEKIENGMRKAVKMWETSKYWQDRAAGALAHAKYKELPAVRARRIKGIEADKRREEKDKKQAEFCIKFWSGELKTKAGESFPITYESALWFCNVHDHISKKFSLVEFPRQKPASQYEDWMSLWSALGGSDGKDCAIITVDQAKEIALRVHARTVARCDRWIGHCDNRLTYEKAMLEEQGGSDLLKPKPRPKQLPLCNYRAPEGLQISRFDGGTKPAVYPQVEMTQAEYAKIWNDYKGTRVVGNSHRVRTAMVKYELVCVFLVDSKTHERPADIEKTAAPREMPAREPARFIESARVEPEPEAAEEAAEFDALKATLKAGVKVVSVPQLFPTPPELARRMAAEAGELAGLRVLEPSAGTGNIVRAIIDHATGADCVRITAVEINYNLVSLLEQQRNRTVYANGDNFEIRQADFLECNGDLGKFDRVIMNPPFERGSDIEHIKHAVKFLKPGGRIVAICAGGPRQERELKPLAEDSGGIWEPLEPGTFKDSGTGVNTVLLTIEAADEVRS